ncbi:hypothetical protein GGI08_006098, partial [Coemansia sp. S2]
MVPLCWVLLALAPSTQRTPRVCAPRPVSQDTTLVSRPISPGSRSPPTSMPTASPLLDPARAPALALRRRRPSHLQLSR